MANQITKTQGSAIGQLGEGVKTGKAKGEAKGGLFSTLVASFQKHIKQDEAGLQAGGKKTSSKEKVAVNGLKKAFLKVKSESTGAADKAKALLKAGGADKTSKGEHVKGKTRLSKPLLQTSDAKSLVEKAGEKKNILSAKKLVDDTEKLQKHVAIGLGIFQQESRQPTINKLGEAEAKEKLLVGLGSKNNKNTEDASKSPRLVIDAQGLAGKKDIAVEQKKTEIGKNKVEKTVAKTVAKAVVTEGKAVKVSSVKQDAQGRFSLQGMNVIDNGIDVSKLTTRNGLASVKSQSKSDAIDITAKNQVKDEKAAAKAVSLASSASAAADVKVTLQDESNKRQMIDSGAAQSKQAKDELLQEGLDASENGSKLKASFKAVAENRSGVAGAQSQATVSVVSKIQSEIALASGSGQDANMAGDDRSSGRSAAELLMSGGAIRDVRNIRSDFAMQMAYRSAASFKPSDAMLEISKAAKDGSIRLELMLEPATLGKIHVSLQTDAQKQIQVHLIVDQQASRQVLEQQLPQLRQALADQGLNLSGFTMDMNSQQQNGGQSSHEMAGMDHMNGHGELEGAMSFEAPLRMGVNVANDGSLSILG